MVGIWKGRSALRLNPVMARPTVLASASQIKSTPQTSSKGIGFFGLFRKSNKTAVIKVVTDVDDTVVSSGGVKIFGIALGGIDNQYKRGQFYPGVIQFGLELSLSASKAVSGAFSPPKVAVLTARAKEFKFALELKASGKLCSAFRALGLLNGVQDWGIGDVYYGSVAEWIFQKRKGWRKFSNFEIMMRNDDEATPPGSPVKQYILVGDTGEKDEEAGVRVAEKHPNRIRAIFLHVVYNHHKPPSALPEDRLVNGVPVFYFRTYVGAAVKAYRNQLISKDAVRRVAERAVQELQSLDAMLAKRDKKYQLLTKIPGGEKMYRKMWEVRESRWEELQLDAKECGFLYPIVSNKQSAVTSRLLDAPV